MDSFLKNLMYVTATALILAAPVLLTLSFCFSWHEAFQALFFLACLVDFIIVLILIIAFADALE